MIGPAELLANAFIAFTVKLGCLISTSLSKLLDDI
jgi:hypothetical protein